MQETPFLSFLGGEHMGRLFLTVFLIFGSSQSGYAQSINVKVSGQTEDQRLSFTGNVLFNVLLLRGQVTGNLNTSQKCTGKSRINVFFTRGSGTLSCGADLRATFDFEVTSRLPVKGIGTAYLDDGRKANLVLWQ